MTKPKAKKETSLVLRTCRADMSSQNGFVWPQVSEIAEAPDWIANNKCGHGLHGWLYGQGDHGCSSYLDSTSKWLVVEVDSDSIVVLGGKCKFQRGKVVFVGDKKDATDYLIANEPRAQNVEVIGACLTVCDGKSVTVGALGTATAGYSGEIRIHWWDKANDRYRTAIGYVGEDGIEANVAYRLDDNHKFVKAQ